MSYKGLYTTIGI